MYGLQGFFSKIVLIVRIFSKIVRICSKKCTDCTDFFPKITDFFWKCTDFCTDFFKKVLATLYILYDFFYSRCHSFRLPRGQQLLLIAIRRGLCASVGEQKHGFNKYPHDLRNIWTSFPRVTARKSRYPLSYSAKPFRSQNCVE